ncbi:hypothetical protein TNCV_4589191 [Trichonephila clavipes]|nr:hypothetical protein TNCV_4589191 [Trichonephila clavipes]
MATDLVILNHGQCDEEKTPSTPTLLFPHQSQCKDVSVTTDVMYASPSTRQVFSSTRLELMICSHESVTLTRSIRPQSTVLTLRNRSRVVADSRVNDSPSHSRFSRSPRVDGYQSMGLPFTVIAFIERALCMKLLRLFGSQAVTFIKKQLMPPSVAISTANRELDFREDLTQDVRQFEDCVSIKTNKEGTSAWLSS